MEDVEAERFSAQASAGQRLRREMGEPFEQPGPYHRPPGTLIFKAISIEECCFAMLLDGTVVERERDWDYCTASGQHLHGHQENAVDPD